MRLKQVYIEHVNLMQLKQVCMLHYFNVIETDLHSALCIISNVTETGLYSVLNMIYANEAILYSVLNIIF
jgi:hypothetical protein